MEKTYRIIHIADLHAGKTNKRFLNRNEDLNYALEQVYDYINEYGADYLIVAGDIFDNRIPSGESLELINYWLLKFSEKTKVVVIGGNHDGVKYLNSITHFAKRLGIKIFPRFSKEDFIFTDGEVAIVGIPFISERGITELSEEGEEQSKINYAEKMRKLLQFSVQKVKDYKYRILTAHLYFAGVRIGHTEKEVTVSESYAVPQSSIPSQFHYVALGHVHRFQRLEGAPTEAFYSGSLYQLDFGESGQDKYFLSVELKDNRAYAEPIKLKLKRELQKIPLLKEHRPELLAKLKKPNNYYWIEIEAETEKDYYQKKQVVERILGEQLLNVTPRFLRDRNRTLFGKHVTDKEQVNLRNPIEMYKLYLAKDGRKMDREVEETLRKLLEQIHSTQ
jgi:exonuclease SbcD